ncbi:MAG TPA: imidazolonepropionase [bacterium]|nr:imidazolonepropionase [bacterium]HQJ63234.1 imidazolonepropionase [bacterium]
MASLLIVNIGETVSATAAPARGAAMRALECHRNAAIHIQGGIIRAIGPRTAVERQITDDPVLLDAEGGAVLPGFVDSHTHLLFAGRREDEFDLKLAGASYQEITAAGGGIISTVAATRRATSAELVEIGLGYLAAALRQGTTTLEIKSGYGLDLEHEIKLLEVIAELGRRQPVEVVPTFMGAHAVPPGVSLQEQTERLLAMLPRLRGMAEFCDAFCEVGYFGIEETRAIFTAARKAGMGLRLHAAQFTNAGAVQLALEMSARSVDHLEQIGPEEISLLAEAECCATLLPGVSFFMHYGYPPARALIDQGAVVAIATNFNPGTCMCLNLQLIFAIACTQMRMTTAEALTALTANAAWSLARPQIGRLLPGMQADLLLLDAPNYRIIPYFFGENHVRMVVKKGEVVIG